MAILNLRFRFLNFRPVSVNDAYIPTARKRKKGGGGFGGAFLRKSDQLKDWQVFVQRAFDEEFFYSREYLNQVASWINGMNIGLRMYLKVSMPEEEYWNPENFTLYRNDASNFIKAIEDAIYKGIGIDDNRNIFVTVEKGYNEDEVWYIEAELSEASISNRIDVDTRGSYYNPD